jgi:hypothetical protein
MCAQVVLTARSPFLPGTGGMRLCPWEDGRTGSASDRGSDEGTRRGGTAAPRAAKKHKREVGITAFEQNAATVVAELEALVA